MQLLAFLQGGTTCSQPTKKAFPDNIKLVFACTTICTSISLHQFFIHPRKSSRALVRNNIPRPEVEEKFVARPLPR